MKPNWRYLFGFTILLMLELYIAMFVRDNFIRPFLGDILVVILIYCLVMTFSKKHYRLLPLYIFLFACAVEISQYFNLAQLLGAAEHPILKTLLGTTFDPADILCYLAGCVLVALYQTIFVFRVRK